MATVSRAVAWHRGNPDGFVLSVQAHLRLSSRILYPQDRFEANTMKIVIPGGTGQVGALLARAFVADGHDVVVLSRGPAKAPCALFDGMQLTSASGPRKSTGRTS